MVGGGLSFCIVSPDIDCHGAACPQTGVALAPASAPFENDFLTRTRIPHCVMRSSDEDRAAVGPRGAGKGSASGRRRWGWMAATALVLSPGACTLLLDCSATQCQNDGDCVRFGGHPYCQSGVCVDSGLKPADCFFGAPKQPAEFENQCTRAACTPFDDCAKLKFCGGPSPALIPPPVADAGMTAPPVSTGDAGGADAASTTPSCIDPSNGRENVVFITGSSNFPPLLGN